MLKSFITKLALKFVPEEGVLRNIAKRIFAKMYPKKNDDIIHRVLTDAEHTRLQEAVKIGFIGDLILLRDMIDLSRRKGEYRYEPMFEAMKPFFEECDLMTGVLEGPLSGDALGYTTANYEDGRDLHCGYPDSFLSAIRDAGIDFVTIANNHMFDKGRKGMERTIEVLEAAGMPYVGYGPKAHTLIEVANLKIAVLAFNFCFNGKKEHFFFEPGNEDLPHLIRPKNSKYYKKCLQTVTDDFRWAKEQQPDCILVYPHFGEQFRHAPDSNQLHWFDIFKSLGANVILGCHPHATQPVRFEDDCLCLYCPGNFVNNYFPYDGDASAMVEVYLDKNTGKPFASAIVPILAYAARDQILAAQPMTALADKNDLSWHDWFRLQDAHRLVTSSMLGVKIPLEQCQSKYIILKDNIYRRLPYEHTLDIIDAPQYAPAKSLFDKAKSIVFIGDSVSEGNKNGGYGWFEPIMASFPEKKVIRYAKGSATANILLHTFESELTQTRADIFCIAVGCNDIRYREETICAMTADQYKAQIIKMVSLIKAANSEATIILVAPWWSDDAFDKWCRIDLDTKHLLYKQYNAALEDVANDYGCIFVNPNPMIWDKIRSGCQSEYLIDWVHPNAKWGLPLFAEAFIDALSKSLKQ